MHRVAVVEPAVVPRGGACRGTARCAAGLDCLDLPGGYCASGCDACPTGGACVELLTGARCLASCTADAECRVAEGYACDPMWKTCAIPNSTAIVAPTCPAPGGPQRDPAFSMEVQVAEAGGSPSAVVAGDGTLVIATIAGEAVRVGATQLAGHAGQLARDAAGTIYVVTQVPGGIAVAYSTDRGVTFSAPQPAHELADCATSACTDPVIAIGLDPVTRRGERLYILYVMASGLRVRASRDRGATFTTASTPLAGNRGSLATSTDGRLHVLGLDGSPHGAYGSADHHVEYVVSLDGGTSFSRPLVVSGRDDSIPFYLSNPSLAVDDRRGWLYAVYARGHRGGVWDLVVAASKDKGKTWKRTRLGDDPPCAMHHVPNVAVDPTTGTLHLAWYDRRGSATRFAHGTCSIGATKCSHKGAISDAPFELSTSPTASRFPGDRAALVIDDKRRLLHAVWVAGAVMRASAKL